MHLIIMGTRNQHTYRCRSGLAASAHSFSGYISSIAHPEPPNATMATPATM